MFKSKLETLGFVLQAVVTTLFFALPVKVVLAHPVTFQGGKSLMSYNTPEMTDFMLGYSWRWDTATAYQYLRLKKSEFHFARVNYLVKRWNQPESQANFYVNLGAGQEKHGSHTSFASLQEVSLDWESRKYYLLGSYTHLANSNSHNQNFAQSLGGQGAVGRDFGKYKLRAGFAPFLGEFEDLNVWYIVQADRNTLSDETELTQMFRFYLRNTLWEIGASTKGNWMLNYMIHF